VKIKEIRLNRFKRFTDLKIVDIPDTAKLVVLVGPNGSGKTSLFEALHHWHKAKAFGNVGTRDYIEKAADETSNKQSWYQNKVQIEFVDDKEFSQEQIKNKFYFRSAYRNEPDFTFANLSKQVDPTQTIRLKDLMQNDLTVSANYQRIVAGTIASVYETSNNTKTVEQLRDELIGRVRTSLSNVFEDLSLSSIGNPLIKGSFYFEKGTTKDFHYKNLSAGEKSVFDLILDLIIKSDFYSDAIFCIDEPEAHMHTRLQSKVLRELYRLIPDDSQIWISTHSIGMLKEAEEIEETNPDTVVFLDFDNRDFDLAEVMRPAKISRTIWDRFFDLAFADFSELIAPRRIVFCEGTSQGRRYKDFDAQIYGKILGEKHHDAIFISIGSCTELEDIENQPMKIVSKILKSSEIIKFVDRDDRSDQEIQELFDKGIKTSERRHIESYVFDDEIIEKLCHSCNKAELKDECLKVKSDAVDDSCSRGNPPDDIKSASGKIFIELKRLLELTQRGNNKCAFIRDTMAPLITEETNVYQEIENEIFGNSQVDCVT